MFKRLIWILCVAMLTSSCATVNSKDNSLLRRIRLLEARVEFNSQLIKINSQKIDSVKFQIEKIKERLAKERKENKSDDELSNIPPASLINDLAKRDSALDRDGAVSANSANDGNSSVSNSNSIIPKKPKVVKDSMNKSKNINFVDYKELYSKALDAYRKREYKKSAELFEKFGSLFKSTDLYDNSIYWLAYCYLHLDKKGKAIGLLNKLVKDFPDSSMKNGGKTDAAIFTLIRIFKKEGNAQKVEYYKNLLLKRFPDSVFVKRINKI